MTILYRTAQHTPCNVFFFIARTRGSRLMASDDDAVISTRRKQRDDMRWREGILHSSMLFLPSYPLCVRVGVTFYSVATVLYGCYISQ